MSWGVPRALESPDSVSHPFSAAWAVGTSFRSIQAVGLPRPVPQGSGLDGAPRSPGEGLLQHRVSCSPNRGSSPSPCCCQGTPDYIWRPAVGGGGQGYCAAPCSAQDAHQRMSPPHVHSAKGDPGLVENVPDLDLRVQAEPRPQTFVLESSAGLGQQHTL